MEFEKEDPIFVRFLKLKKKQQDFHFFFKTNRLNPFQFFRTNDLKYENNNGIFSFPVFKANDEIRDTQYLIIVNCGCLEKVKDNPNKTLFDFVEKKHFIDEEIDFILFSKQEWADYSTICFPENEIEISNNEELNKKEELYQIIINYDE